MRRPPGPSPGYARVTRRGGKALPAIVAGLAAFIATGATADTVYLRNGRVIHAETTEVVDGNLVLSQYGGTVSIPLAAVDRVEKDDTSERRTREPASAAGAEPAATGVDAPEDVATANEPETGSPADLAVNAAGTPGHPWSKPEYWIERIVEVDDRIERVQAELDRLPYYSEVDQRVIISGQIMYFVAERARWETFMKRLQARRDELERGARRAGVPPGDLRAVRRR